jgi:hypothetical protein
MTVAQTALRPLPPQPETCQPAQQNLGKPSNHEREMTLTQICPSDFLLDMQRIGRLVETIQAGRDAFHQFQRQQAEKAQQELATLFVASLGWQVSTYRFGMYTLQHGLRPGGRRGEDLHGFGAVASISRPSPTTSIATVWPAPLERTFRTLMRARTYRRNASGRTWSRSWVACLPEQA